MTKNKQQGTGEKGTAADYEIGRGKPPKHTRFKTGQSGNPGGRKKGSVNVKTIIRTIAESEIEISERGEKRTVTVLEAVVMRHFHAALQGDGRARQDVLDRCERHLVGDDDDSTDLPEEDAAVVERAMERAIARSSPRRKGVAKAKKPRERRND